MWHQTEGLRRMDGREEFALLCEQGTGKTWIFLAHAERLYAAGKIDALLVVAPKGGHINWVKREIPAHLEAPHVAVWFQSGTNKKQLAEIERLMAPREEGELVPLRILAMNWDALITKRGRQTIDRFLNATRAMIVADESHRIKNPAAARTKVAWVIARNAVARYIGTGTPITNAPTDAFAQFEFMRSGMLGTTSYRAFVAEYAELVPEDSRLMDHVRDRIANKRFLPQIVQRDSMGRKKWRNLEKLHALIAPHSYRVLKSECMDLPPKVYTTHYFELTAAQRRMYDDAEKNLRIELDACATFSERIVTFQKMNRSMKLQQITSGFVMVDGVPVLMADSPRIDALMEVLEDVEGSFIVWAHFTEEIRQIHSALRERGITCGMYYGDTKDKDRDALVDDFQAGTVRAFIGQPAAGGTSLTLTAATTVIYFSNSHNLEERLQSEDRAHRKGTTESVQYIDLAAVDTVDEPITRALQYKEEVAQVVLGDWAKKGDQKNIFSQ
jgi:SNF2 family DNA or RNA helicase